MTENKVELLSDGIKRALKKYSMYESISEYIWNGFDAEAKLIKISFSRNEFNAIIGIDISDDGYGIEFDLLIPKFKPVFESNKILERDNKQYTSNYHGKNGIGRLTFFSFADKAKWVTIYKDKGDSKNKTYQINVDSNSLQEFPNTQPVETENATGTTVSFELINAKFELDELIDFLKVEFAWYLKLRQNENCEIIIEGVNLDYSDILQEEEKRVFKYDPNGTIFEVTYCRWSKYLNNEFSKYYYIDSKDKEVAKEYTSLNKKGDKFYHSVYIKSAFFDNFSYDKKDYGQLKFQANTKSSIEFLFINKQVDMYLREKRNPFIKAYTSKYLEELDSAGAMPQYNIKNPLEKFKKEALEDVISNIYCVEPQVFTNLNKVQKCTLVRMFDLIINTGEIENFFKILEGILDLTENEKQELSGTLEYIKFSSITKVINLLKDRKLAVDYLKTLVYDEKQFTLETPHLQQFIEKHYWLFGEQYHLVTAEEPDFVEALRRFTYVLRGEKPTRKDAAIDHEHHRKQMDIFAVQQAKDGDSKKCIVVELKRPSLKLGRHELDQVKKYFDLILNEDRFNAPNIQWIFYLVGNSFKSEINSELKNAEIHGERSLVFKGERHKIFVKTWSEIITEFEINHEFIMSKLVLEQEHILSSKTNRSIDIIDEQMNNSAVQPKEIVI